MTTKMQNTKYNKCSKNTAQFQFILSGPLTENLGLWAEQSQAPKQSLGA